tara:strand:- start:12176 stop:12409 length:234 start_codon:yes stop_codon:yes gene_type:complete
MAWFDNGPIQRMEDEVYKRVRQLGFKGCEVLQVRLDSFKATIQVAEPCGLDAQFEGGGFAGVQWGDVRVVWRTSCDS